MKQLKDNGISYENQNFYIGIDVHKKQWTISVIFMNMVIVKGVTIKPEPKELQKFMKNRFNGGNYYAVYEAGFSGFWAARELKEIGIKCIVVHPADLPTTQKERNHKNDKVDSKKLARSLHNNDLTGIYIPESKSEEIRYLIRHRARIIKDQTRIKNRIKSTLAQFGKSIPVEMEDRRWSRGFIAWLQTIEFETKYGQIAFDDLIDQLLVIRGRLLGVVRAMRAMVKESEELSGIFNLLLTVPGIGFITAMTIVTEIIKIDRFKSLGELAAFVGLIPDEESSDEKQKNKGVTKRRNKYLRSMLVEAAWTAVKKDPVLTMKYAKLCRRMNKNKAIIRIAKMLLSRIKHVWKNNEPYVCAVMG
jgi:transposase